MISRQHIRQFLAVVDTGSFTRAAESIGIAQPSLSIGIRDLEERLGEPLFDRQRPAVRLTAAGNRLLPIARRINSEFLRAERYIPGLATKARPFILGVMPTLAIGKLAQAIGQVTGLELEIIEKDAASLLRAVRQGRIDCALTDHAAHDVEGLRILPLSHEDYGVLLPDGHRLAAQAVVDAEDLAGEVMIARRSCERLRETSAFFISRGVRPRFSFKSHNDERALALVAAGLGITVAPRSLASEGTRFVGLADFNLRRTIGLAARANDYASAGAYRHQCDRLFAAFRAAFGDQA
ncbi:MAG: LysR family transcriptional regulator [Blastomonas fulva]|uniref:LysR family transcriptional regulator n=1 Tax=Blastomonas fulva TaxID=1550728 RepID=UPI0024E24EAA|nr:LysR family transcriptional regulator [Blastomonas fulva]MDK2758080.1 LysR family transcriptional regulator [Blastomonas fulva]